MFATSRTTITQKATLSMTLAVVVVAGFFSCGSPPSGTGTPSSGTGGASNPSSRGGSGGNANVGTGGMTGGTSPASGGAPGPSAGGTTSGGAGGGTSADVAGVGSGGMAGTVETGGTTGGADTSYDSNGQGGGAGAAGGTMRIYWVDAEGGAATLVVGPGGETLLADAGWGSRDVNRVVAVLEKEVGKKKLDYFVATHYHVDHVAGVAALARAIPIDNFIDHGPSVEGGGDFNTYRSAVMSAMGGAKRISVTPGMKFMLGGVELTIVAAGGKVAQLPTAIPNPACAGTTMRRDTPDEDPQSVGFVARFGKFEFVDLGDLTAGVEHNLVCPMNQIGLVDLFQSSQHGEDESNPVQLVHGFQPQVIVVNNGASKGAKPAVMERFKTSPGLKDLWAVHRKAGQSDAQNADEALIANSTGPDMGHFIRATIKSDGTFEVTNGRTNMSRSYVAR